MAEPERRSHPWMSANDQSSMVHLSGHDTLTVESAVGGAETAGSSDVQSHRLRSSNSSDTKLGFAERALSAAGAAVLSAVIVNPLDVAKVIPH